MYCEHPDQRKHNRKCQDKYICIVNTQTNAIITESAMSQYRCIYLGTFCYACVGLCVHNTDLFILALSVRLVLVWVFTIQIYLSWHFLLYLHWSGCSQYRFIYLGTFCYACVEHPDQHKPN
jgi:hypothetical protein